VWVLLGKHASNGQTMPRIHILGASGSGTTTLGTALAARLGCVHADSDDFFWQPTDPPYTQRRPMPQRFELLRQHLAGHEDWVFSGSAVSWAHPLEELYDIIVFLRLDPALRMRRLRQREQARYGARIAEGGDLAVENQAFLAWAEAYDDAGPTQRSLSVHEAWLAEIHCPVLRLDSAQPVEALIASVMTAITP